MERQRRLKERFFLLLGIVMGALLGIFGNLWVVWYFETYKEASWMPYVAWSSLGVVLFILACLAILLGRWERELGKFSSSDVRT
jgi:membrane protein implicated in regulation of membrane protease activity